MILTAYCVSVCSGRGQGPSPTAGFTAKLTTATYGDPIFEVVVSQSQLLGETPPFEPGKIYILEIGEQS